MGGLMIPKIPGVQVDLLNIPRVTYSNLSKFYLELNEIMKTNVVKCLLIHMTLDAYNSQGDGLVSEIIKHTRTT